VEILLFVAFCLVALVVTRFLNRDMSIPQKLELMSQKIKQPLKKTAMRGNGFTKEDGEVQLVNDEISVLYTRTVLEDDLVVETAHIMLSFGNFLTITSVGNVPKTIGGNSTNTHDPELLAGARMQIAKLFLAIDKAMKE
jgi:hypothetical protein